jgi:hypothetical protein
VVPLNTFQTCSKGSFRMSNATRTSLGGEQWLPSLSSKHVAAFDKEAAAWGHWILGPSPEDLVDEDNSNRTLTPETYLKAAATGFVTLYSQQGNSLVSTLADSNVGTWCAVFRVASLPSTRIPIVGTLSTPGNKGMHAMITSTGAIQVYGEQAGDTNYTHNFHSAFTYPNKWLFVAVARDWDLAVPQVTVYLGSQGAETKNFTDEVYDPGGSTVFGSRFNNLIGAGQPDLLLSEGILFEQRLSTVEMEAVYLRSKERMKHFGRTVV